MRKCILSFAEKRDLVSKEDLAYFLRQLEVAWDFVEDFAKAFPDKQEFCQKRFRRIDELREEVEKVVDLIDRHESVYPQPVLKSLLAYLDGPSCYDVLLANSIRSSSWMRDRAIEAVQAYRNQLELIEDYRHIFAVSNGEFYDEGKMELRKTGEWKRMKYSNEGTRICMAGTVCDIGGGKEVFVSDASAELATMIYYLVQYFVEYLPRLAKQLIDEYYGVSEKPPVIINVIDPAMQAHFLQWAKRVSSYAFRKRGEDVAERVKRRIMSQREDIKSKIELKDVYVKDLNFSFTDSMEAIALELSQLGL